MSSVAVVQDLIARGGKVCSCGGVCLPTATSCRFCGATLPTPAPGPGATPGASRKRRNRPAPFNPDGGRGRIGTLGDLPDQTLVLVVYGRPAPQGSLIAVAPGVIRREKGPELVAWRDAITVEALRVCGSTWVPANSGAQVDVTLTVPRPSSAPKNQAVPADGYRDLDKLVRAVNDALCPDDPARFRVLASDMRVTRTVSAKTHPRPLHTDPWALDTLGVVVRVTPAVPVPEDPADPILRFIQTRTQRADTPSTSQ